MNSFSIRKLRLLAGLLLFCATASLAGDAFNPDSIIGVWMTGEGKAKVQIYRNGGKYFGKIVWLKNPNYSNGQPKMDHNNPNHADRAKPLIGRVILRDFTYDPDDKEYDDGYIYDPENGSEYSSYMAFTDANTLHVRGYIGISLIGRTQEWKRDR